MRRIMLAGVCAVVLMVPLQAAKAEFVRGTFLPETIVGSQHKDRLYGKRGEDVVMPQDGRDIVRGGRGNDLIRLQVDQRRDRIHCGPGFDVVSYTGRAWVEDYINPNCEGVVL